MKIKFKTICWYTIAAALFFVFWKYSPAVTLHSLGIVLYILEAAIFGFFLFIALIDLENFKDLKALKQTKYPKLLATKTLLIVILSVLFSLVFFSLSTTRRIHRLFQTQGIETIATVIDGESKTSLSAAGVNQKCKINLVFRDQDSIERKVIYETSKDIFDKLYIDQTIRIKYLPDNYEMITILGE